MGVIFDLAAAGRTVGAAEREARMADPGFGTVFTDHMVSAKWTDGQWHDEAVLPYGPLTLDPAAATIHYAQSVFEGLRVFRARDGHLAVFRPEDHATRFQRSSRRLAMPEVPGELFLGAIEELVRLDGAWVPDNPEITLYLRPVLFATEPYIGLRPSRSYRFLLLACVAESLIGRGRRALTVWVSDDYSRATPGGTGAAKYAGNYPGAYLAQAQAEAHGCDQVVWVDAAERRWVEEMSAMNVFFVREQRGGSRQLVTPPLTGTLLSGITRDSVMTLAREIGFDVVEEPVSVTQWRNEAESGAITETFACGTAARISSIGRVSSAGGDWTIGDGAAGPVAQELAGILRDVQLGDREDRYGWMYALAYDADARVTAAGKESR